MPLPPSPSQGLGITLSNSPHPPSPLRISTTSSPPLEPRDQARAGAYSQGSPTKAGVAGTRLRVKTNDPDHFVLRPTHYTHSPTATATGTVKSLRTSKPLGPRSSPRVGISPSARIEDQHVESGDKGFDQGDRAGGENGLRVEVEEMYRDEGEEYRDENDENENDDCQRLVPSSNANAAQHLAPSRAPSSASVISSTSFSASTHHTSSSKAGKMGRMKSSEVLRRRGVAKEGGRYMQLEGGGDEGEDKFGDVEGGGDEGEDKGGEIIRSPLSEGNGGYQEEQRLSTTATYSFPYPPLRIQQTVQETDMPRSMSQPMHLYSVPSFFDPSYTTPSSAGEYGDSYRYRDVELRSRPNGRYEELRSRPNGRYTDDELHSRPWSESTLDHSPVSRLHPHQHAPRNTPRPNAPKQRGRSLSDGAELLVRQGTLLHPASGTQRSSQELGILLGGARSRRLSRDKLLPAPSDVGGEKVRLEASKKGRARVTVDVVAERECVVEGGEVRGRVEVRVGGGRGSAGLRVGGGKVRVVGFEELASARHVFYHQAHALDSPSPLFASPPDADGFRLAAPGAHSIPFCFPLPPAAGAKGTFTPAHRGGPSVRYVLVASLKLLAPATRKRSIAHFYRPIVLLPRLDPARALAPSTAPLEAATEKGLGWSLAGDRGAVRLRVAMGRATWVSGQRLWCHVGIRNGSLRKIKHLSLALLQDVRTFAPAPAAHTDQPVETQRKKVAEEAVQGDFTTHGAGRVTGKGWWTGVEPGESGHWDMSIQVPTGLLSIRRTKLVDISYTLRVTLNNSIYVDFPVTLISFLSIDPPPMPSGSGATGSMGIAEWAAGDTDAQVHKSLTPTHTPAARPSSTTLHPDPSQPLVQPPPSLPVFEPHSQPESSTSTYTSPSKAASAASLPNLLTIPTYSRAHAHVQSNSPHLSAFSGFSPHPETYPEDDPHLDIDDENQDTISRAQNRAKGRQRSLMIIRAEMEREDEERRLSLAQAWEADTQGNTHEGTFETDVERTPMPEPSSYLPRTEMDTATETDMHRGIEELLEMEEEGWDFDSVDGHPASPQPSQPCQPYQPYQPYTNPEMDTIQAQSFHQHVQNHGQGQELELVDEERHELEQVLPHPSHSHELERYQDEEDDVDERDRDDESHAWGYDDELALHSEDEHDRGDTPTATPRRARPRALSSVAPAPAIAAEAEGEAEGEGEQEKEEAKEDGEDGRTGKQDTPAPQAQTQTQTHVEPVKRHISVRVPPQLLPSLSSTSVPSPTKATDSSPTKTIIRSGSVPSLRAKVSREALNERLEGVVKKSGIVSSSMLATATATATTTTTGRRVSVLSKKESMSSLASVAEVNVGGGGGGGGAKVVQKKNSFSFATPGSPLKIKIPLSPTPNATTTPSIPSPRKTSRNPSPTKLSSSPISKTNRNPSPTKSPLISKPMERGPSDASVKSQATNAPPPISSSSSQPPPLASPRASDSASSEGRWLESPRGEEDVQQLHFLSPASGGGGGGYQSFSPLISSPGSPHDGLEWGLMQQQQQQQQQQQGLGSPFTLLSLRPPADSVMSRLSLPHPRSPYSSGDHQPMAKHDSLPIPFDDISIHASPSSTPSSPSSCHSMLPSVKTKIAQMESREEALRKFSVSGSAMLSSPLPLGSSSSQRQKVGARMEESSPERGWRNDRGEERKPPIKRKSYTTALAPRPNRTESKTSSPASRPSIPRQTSASTMHSCQSMSSGSSYEYYDPIYAPESNTSTPKVPKRLLPTSPSATTTPTASPRNSVVVVNNGRLPISSPASTKSTTTSYGDLMGTPKLDPFGLGYTSGGMNGVGPGGGRLHKVDEEGRA
ncbi:hypothetical protein C354_06775 [Cryptococcus neoformans MW-RSA1955]|nr:hypothetical protein C353_06796 [Cryptococcus neoformans var. grubii AD1-83a]OXG43723.1 hypothetical protein C354_06775 [Cryptococcus neoformans var. grubii MW-RSA1955]